MIVLEATRSNSSNNRSTAEIYTILVEFNHLLDMSVEITPAVESFSMHPFVEEALAGDMHIARVAKRQSRIQFLRCPS